jgi:hypothetical protein
MSELKPWQIEGCGKAAWYKREQKRRIAAGLPPLSAVNPNSDRQRQPCANLVPCLLRAQAVRKRNLIWS